MENYRNYSPGPEGLARFTVDRRKDVIRYAVDANRFYKYTGTHWMECSPGNVEVGSWLNKVADFVKDDMAAFGSPPGKDSPDFPDWAVATAFRKLAMTASGTASVISKMKEDERVWCSVSDFEQQPYLVNFLNGTVNVKMPPEWQDPVTGEYQDEYNFLPHDPAHMLSSVLNARYPEYEYNPTPLWTSLLLRMCGGDESLAMNLECALAYGLLGSNPDQLAVFLVGDAAIGKSQALEIVAKLAGSTGGHGKIELIQRSQGSEHDTVRSDIRGKRFVLLGEASHRLRMDETKFKDLTGSQEVITRKLGQQGVQTRVTWTLYCATNDLPEIPGVMDEAMARRFWIFPLPGKTLPEKERDADLTQRIIDAEGPSILYRLVRQLAYAYSKGDKFRRHPRCTAALDAYRAESNTVADFASECLRVDEGASVRYDEIHTAYVTFCKKRGLSQVSRRSLPRELAAVMMCERDTHNSRYKGISVANFEAPSWA